jgi:tocopherol O-methyltransferase
MTPWDPTTTTDVPVPADVATHYDEMDDVYREVWSDHAHHGLWHTGRESLQEALDAVVDVAADAASVGAGTRVVDVGSGYGATGRRLARGRDARVTSFTISERQHEFAVRADAGDHRLRQELRDWLDNGLADASQDALVAIESIGHMDQGPALAECRRVLVPGGRLVVLDLLAGDHVPRWQVRPLLRRMEKESHLVPLVAEAVFRERLEAAGFVVDEVRDLTRQVRSTWPRAVARILRRIPTEASVRKVLFSDEYENQGFLLSIVRMTLGYRLGAVRFCLVSAHVPD